MNNPSFEIISAAKANYQHISTGAFILIDKPFGWTSFDVVNKLRGVIKRLLCVKKYKIGHAGTLDPFATGMLILGASAYTKRIHLIQDMPKKYIGTMMLGATTPSYDKETSIDNTYPYDHITIEEILTSVKSFIGNINQTPPIFSAIKIGGRPAYKAARKGEKIDMPAKKISIYSIDIVETNLPEIKFEVRCGKGTYIRSLVHDIGRDLNSGAHLTDLRRTAIGAYDINQALSLDNFIEAINNHYDNVEHQ